MPRFKYTHRQAKDIYKAFKHAGLPSKADWPKLLDRITAIACKALAMHAQAKQVRNSKGVRLRPNVKEAKRQLQAVRDACCAFENACKALDPTVERFLASHFVDQIDYAEYDFKAIRALGEAARAAELYKNKKNPHKILENRFQANGRPKDEVIWFFLFNLCGIYRDDDVMDKMPSTGYNQAKGQVAGHFYNVAAATLAPLKLIAGSSIGNYARRASQLYRKMLPTHSKPKVNTRRSLV